MKMPNLQTNYRSQMAGLLDNDQQHLEAIRRYDRTFAKDTINNPYEFLPAFDKHLKELVLIEHNAIKHDTEHLPSYVGLHGGFCDNHVNLRTLRAMYLGKLVCIEGILI